ncbi:hypothetical protein V498_03385 [Pseudogymnoascus sp. VKM F-4517 (FW-2822)]|nr:hypothetical protein V498_03385 [Pseudogymnoascus sp. VKM F-4517 (FW-2822)]
MAKNRGQPVPLHRDIGILDECINAIPIRLSLNGQIIRPRDDIAAFLRSELETSRIDRIFDRLWLAGIKSPARALHRQVMLRREIVVTEDINKHLVADESVIFIKPLPDYLLNIKFWETYLCSDRDLYSRACGLLLSYCWLIQYKSDFFIANENHLIPDSLKSWTDWTAQMEDLLHQTTTSPEWRVHQRYRYGELRLKTLNHIYKLDLIPFSLSNGVNGFMRGPMWYGHFIAGNLTRLFAIFAFFSLVLSAFQVGLAIEDLQKNYAFNRAAIVITLASMFVVSIGALGIIVASVVLPLYYTLWPKKNENYPDNEP